MWTPNNRAATTTWLTLLALSEIPRDLVFKEAGSRKMKDLTFFASGASIDSRRIAASALAIQMDSMFRDIRGAQYEKGKSFGTAVSAIVEVLLDPDKTLAELAETNDDQYLFWRES